VEEDNVIDLMDALKKSLKAKGGNGHSTRKRARS
jgi:non-homologous end joining protein Ku